MGDRQRGAWILAGVATTVVCGAEFEVIAGPDDPVLQVGQRAPAFALPVSGDPDHTRGLRRRAFRLFDYVGAAAKRPQSAVVVNFAASYCEPCKDELAALKRYAPALKAAEATVVVVVIDTEPAGLREMVELTTKTLALGPPFVVVTDRFGVLARRYGATSLPMSVVVGKDGRIRWMQTGFKPGSVERLMAAALPVGRARPGDGAGALRP